MRKDGSFVKSQRIQEISRRIAKGFSENKGQVLLRQIMVYCMAEIGLTENRSVEYIELACESKGWMVQKDVITNAC